MFSVSGRPSPYSIEAEQSVLGSVLLEKDLFATIIDVLRTDDFYTEQNGQIYDAMLTLYRRNDPIDLVTITELLKDRDLLEKCGGIGYLTDLSRAPDFSQNIEAYAKIVKDKSILRKLINASNQTIQNCYDNSLEVLEVLDKAEKAVFDVAQEKDHRGLTPIKKIVYSNFELLQELYENENKLTGLTTGFADLDRKLGGMQKTDLILIAARPAMGKTAFSLNLAVNASLKGKAKVAVFNLEMSKEQLVQRMTSAMSTVELNKIKNGQMNDEEWTKLSKGMGIISNLPIYVDDSPAVTAVELRSKCRRLKAEHGLDLILIDYLQLMESDGRTESRQQEISKISRALKILAKELECPVIALSQLSRAPEMRANNHRPILSDLRESGAIEQDADLVMFLYRDDYYNKNSEQKNITEVIIAKHRHGETGTVPLTWFGQYQLFKDTADPRISAMFG